MVQSDEKVLDQVAVNDPTQNLNIALSTGFDLEVTVKNKSDEFKFTIEDAKVS